MGGLGAAATFGDPDAVSRFAVRLTTGIRARGGAGQLAVVALATALVAAAWLLPSNLDLRRPGVGSLGAALLPPSSRWQRVHRPLHGGARVRPNTALDIVYHVALIALLLVGIATAWRVPARRLGTSDR